MVSAKNQPKPPEKMQTGLPAAYCLPFPNRPPRGHTRKRFPLSDRARGQTVLSAVGYSVLAPRRSRHPMTGLQGGEAPAAGNFPILRPHPIHRITVPPVLTPLPPGSETPARTPQVLASVAIVGKFHGKPKRLGSRSERSDHGKRRNRQKRSCSCRLLLRAGSGVPRRLRMNLAGGSPQRNVAIRPMLALFQLRVFRDAKLK